MLLLKYQNMFKKKKKIVLCFIILQYNCFYCVFVIAFKQRVNTITVYMPFEILKNEQNITVLYSYGFDRIYSFITV